MVESRTKWNKNQLNWITIKKVVNKICNKGQCCQQLNYSDLAIKTALTTELRSKIGPVKVKNYVLRISCSNISTIQRLTK